MTRIAICILILTLSASASDKTYVDTTGWEIDEKAPSDAALREFVDHAKKACFKGHAMSCQLVGESFSVSDQPKDYHEALKYFSQGCTLKLPISCLHAGYLYENGYGVRQDIAEAWELYGKSCDYGMQEGCDQYARINRRYQK
ncbi:MAG: tetratricopeptide repeat protein [Campylobacterota bacterium]